MRCITATGICVLLFTGKRKTHDKWILFLMQKENVMCEHVIEENYLMPLTLPAYIVGLDTLELNSVSL